MIHRVRVFFVVVFEFCSFNFAPCLHVGCVIEVEVAELADFLSRCFVSSEGFFKVSSSLIMLADRDRDFSRFSSRL